MCNTTVVTTANAKVPASTDAIEAVGSVVKLPHPVLLAPEHCV